MTNKIRRIILIGLVISILSSLNVINAFSSDIDIKPKINDGKFEYYLVSNSVFDEFLDDVNNIGYLKINSKYEIVNQDEQLFVIDGIVGSGISSDVIEILSYRDRVIEILNNRGIKSEIYDYMFFKLPNMPMSFNMPLFVWIKTADGVRFATIYQSLNNKCDIDSIYRVNEFIKKFGLNSTKVYVNGKNTEYSYAKLRGEGAEFSLRDIIESIGGEFIWDAPNKTAKIRISADILNTKDALEDIVMEIALADFKDEYYSAVYNFYDPNLKDVYQGKSVKKFCKLVDNEIVVDDETASGILALLDGNGSSEIDVKSRVSINWAYGIDSEFWKLTFDDTVFNFLYAPIIVDDNITYAPMRTLFVLLGAEVLWNENTNSAIAAMPDKSISVSIDSNILVDNGEVIYLSAPVKLINDKTYIPIVDLENVLNYSIDVDENLKRIDMIKK